MELIKQIKDAETQAGQIIEQAKANTVKQAEETRKSRQEALAQARQQRKKAIDAASAEAEKQAKADIEQLNAQAEKARRQLGEKVSAKIPASATKVTDYLKGLN